MLEVSGETRFTDWSGKWNRFSYYSVDWTLQSSKLTIKPCLADSHVHMSPARVDSSSVVGEVSPVIVIRTCKLGMSELELYHNLAV